MKTNIFVRALTATFILIFALIINITAQTDQGRIAGTITDANGGVVPGASVTVTSDLTGEVRTVTTKDDGSFMIVALKPSKYTVAASGGNFETTRKTVEVLVGQQLALDLVLQAKGVAAQVDIVSGEDTIVNTSSASMSANVNPREVAGLPINGRQLSQLYLQAPGGVNSGTGTFADIRFSGRANQQNVIRYDGVEGTAIIDASPGNLNGEVPSPFRLQSSLENVQEFRVDSSNFPAEFGTGTGGQISVVTKSGGNRFHGSMFEYMRRDGLDARNFFDGATKSPLKLDQFGGSIGGPIVKDKLFFFASYEQYRGRFGLNFIELAPMLSLAQPGAFVPGSTTTLVNPAIQPYIAAFRSPKSVVLPGAAPLTGYDIVQLQDLEKTDEKSFAARFDYQVNPMNKLYVRVFRDQGKDISPEGISGRIVTIEAVPQNGVAGWQSIVRQDGSLINEFKIGYNGARTRINGTAPTVNGLDFSAVTLNISGSIANAGIAGQGTLSGISSPGGLVRANSATNGRGQPYTPYSLGFIDSLNWTRGDHNFKFGGEVRLIRMYTDRLGGTTYSFSNLNAFLTGPSTPATVQYLGDVSAPSPFNAGLTGQRLAKQEYYIGYGQDEWKVRRGLTLSYGLRYEYYAPLHEQNDGQVLFNIETGQLRPSSEAAYKSSKTNFGPRVALSWSPDHDGTGFFSGGKTVLRGGVGIFYGPGQTEDQIQPIESDRVSSTISSSVSFGGQQLLAFPAPISAIVANFNANPLNRQYQPRAYANNYKIPERVFQYTFSWQQQLPYNIVTTVSYVGAQGRNLFLRSVANKILPGNATVLNSATAFPTGVGVINRVNGTGQVTGVTTVREFDIVNNATACGVSATNPVCKPFAEVDYKTVGGDDRYNALQLSAQRGFRNGLTMNAQYTFGKSEGTSAGSNEARTSAQLDNFEADRGRNNFDVRHTFNLSALYDLPLGKGKRYDLGSAGNAILGNWEIGGILNARSGVPVEVLVVRPDVVVQCQLAGGCPNGTGGTFANGFVANLPSFGSAFPALPTGFVAVVNTPGGGNSRNIRRPNLIAGVNPYLGSDRNFINPAAFATPGPGEWGNFPRNELSGPGFKQFDMIFAKKLRFTETVNFEFRTEIFNIFNQTNFANPSTTLNNSLPSLSFNSGTGAYTATSGANVVQPDQAFSQGAAGSTFGLLRSTVGRTVGLGSNRQVQFAFRLNF